MEIADIKKGIEIIEKIEKELNDLKMIFSNEKEQLLKIITESETKYVLEYLNKKTNQFIPILDQDNNPYEFYSLVYALDYINEHNFKERVYIYDKEKKIHRKTIKQENKWVIKG
ncbi:MAG: hypothetical protein IKP65_02405 [Alphaproteobacteria bacterium]|nr:hypothetical protein [Alphaproteobacteria bacterium]